VDARQVSPVTGIIEAISHDELIRYGKALEIDVDVDSAPIRLVEENTCP